MSMMILSERFTRQKNNKPLCNESLRILCTTNIPIYHLLFYRIVPVASPGMTTGNPANGQPSSFKQPIFPECLDGIYRTTGRKPASGTEPGRNNQLINPDQKNQRVTKYLKNGLHVKSVSVFPKADLNGLQFLHKKEFLSPYK